jgi:hypothetical protein
MRNFCCLVVGRIRSLLAFILLIFSFHFYLGKYSDLDLNVPVLCNGKTPYVFHRFLSFSCLKAALAKHQNGS